MTVRHRLEVIGLTRSFGGNVAVRDVSFGIPPNQVTGLIGPNGAGKTTLFNLAAGTLQPDGGRILFEGHSLQGLSTGAIARLGLVRCFQAATVFPGVSVREHLVRAGYLRYAGRPIDLLHRRRINQVRDAASAGAEEILQFLELVDVADREAATLAYGLQKILGVGMALAMRPRMILADEPAAGLNHAETERMGKLLGLIRRERGIDILLVEHDLRLVMRLCDRIIALDAGVLIADGEPAEVRSNPAFIAAYIGESDAA